VLLTGMGNDGAAEMTDVRRHGGRTIAESGCVKTVPGD
jgi:two-component system chemotaxis response regulator CheB